MAVENTQVRLLTSTDTGAPTLGYTAGQLITLFDAAFVNGYNEQTLTSLVVASNIATATVAAGHGFTMRGSGDAAFGQVIRIAGATPSELNGDWRIRSVTSPTEFTFEVSGISDQTATGTITAKVAPLGWTKPYSGTNKAAYRLGGGSQRYLRVDDSANYEARVVGYDAMTTIDLGTEPFPTATQRSGGLYLGKRNTASGSTNWFIVGTDRLAYIGLGYASGNPVYAMSLFGDLNALAPIDIWATVLGASVYGYTSYSFTGHPWYKSSGSTVGVYAVRPWLGVGTSQDMQFYPPNFAGVGYSGANNAFDYPNPCDNTLILSGPAYLGLQASTGLLRAIAPGAAFVNNHIVDDELGAFSELSFRKMPDVTGYLAGKKLMGFYLMAGGASNEGYGFLDPLGPWT